MDNRGLGVLSYIITHVSVCSSVSQSTYFIWQTSSHRVGFPMIFQAMINMAVAVELLPVTGQTLPLVSSGGTSIWMTCIALGIME
jgi:cell division protein FtsW